MFEPIGSAQYKTMLNWFGTLYRSSCSQAFHKKGAANSFKKKKSQKSTFVIASFLITWQSYSSIVNEVIRGNFELLYFYFTRKFHTHKKHKKHEKLKKLISLRGSL